MVAKARKKLTAAAATSMYGDDAHDDDHDDDAHGDAAVKGVSLAMATGKQKGRHLGLDDVRKDNDAADDDDDEDDDKYDTSIGHGSDTQLMKPSNLILRRNNISSSLLHSLPSTNNHPPLPSFPTKTSSSSSIPLPPLSQSNIDLLTHQHHKKKPSTKTNIKSSGNSKPSSLGPHVKRVDNHDNHHRSHDHHDNHHSNRTEDNHNATAATAAAVRRGGHQGHSKGNLDPSIAPTVSSSTSFIRIDTNKVSNHYKHHTSDKTIPPIVSIISNEQPQTLSPAQLKELEKKKKAHDLLQSLYYKHVESSEDEYDEEGDKDDDLEGSGDALEAEYLRLREEFNRKLKLAASMNAATAYAPAQSNAGNDDGDDADDDDAAPVSKRNYNRFDDNRGDSSTYSTSPIDDGLDRHHHHHHHRGSEEYNRSSPFVHTSGSVTTSYSDNNRQISTSELLKVWQMEDEHRMMDEHHVDDDAGRMDDDRNHHQGSPDHDEDSYYRGHNADDDNDDDEDIDDEDHAIKRVNSSRSNKSSRLSTTASAADTAVLDDVQCLALLQRLSQKIEL
jgi:hypothetical protein